MRKLCILLLFSLVTTATYSQNSTAAEKFESFLVPGKKGAVLAYSGKERGFTISIEADSVKPTEHPGFMYVNGQVIQSSIVAIPQSLYADSLSEQRQYEIIRAYIQYELNYFKNELKIKYHDLTMNPGTDQGRPFVIWIFNMPKSKSGPKQQLYLTSICFNQTHSLNIPLTDTKDFEKSVRLLVQLQKTLTQYNHTLDPTSLYKELEKN